MKFPKYSLPIGIGVGSLFVLGAGLRINAMAKKRKAASVPQGNSPPVQLSNGTVVTTPVTPSTTVAQAAAIAKGQPPPPAKPNEPTMADLAAAIASPSTSKLSFDNISVEQFQAAQDLLDAQNRAKVGQPIGVRGIVTTNDAPPSGDLIIRSAPSASAPQIGGAEKNGTVTVLDSSDATFAKIQWNGGSRWPAVTGFARKAFIKIS